MKKNKGILREAFGLIYAILKGFSTIRIEAAFYATNEMQVQPK